MPLFLPFSRIDPNAVLDGRVEIPTAPPSYLPGASRLARPQAERIYRGSATR
jgi:hypothetical protein